MSLFMPMHFFFLKTLLVLDILFQETLTTGYVWTNVPLSMTHGPIRLPRYTRLLCGPAFTPVGYNR